MSGGLLRPRACRREAPGPTLDCFWFHGLERRIVLSERPLDIRLYGSVFRESYKALGYSSESKPTQIHCGLSSVSTSAEGEDTGPVPRHGKVSALGEVSVPLV